MPDRSDAINTWSERTLLFLGVIFYLLVFPHGTHGDAYPRYLAVEALVTRGEWIVHKYPMIGPLFSVPLYYLGYVVKHPHWWVSRFNTFCFLAFLAAFHKLLRAEIPDAGARRRLSLLFLVGTMFTKHVTDYYGEVFTSCLAAISLAVLVLRAHVAGLVGLSFSLGSSISTILAHFFATSRLACVNRRWRYWLPMAGGVALIFAENLFRFGTLVSEQYLRDTALTNNVLPYASMNGFHYPLLFGLLSICLSFGKGIFFFCPGLLALPFALGFFSEKIAELVRVYSWYVLGLLLVYAKWCHWAGDWFWGPRYFLFACFPATLAVFALLEKKRSGFAEGLATLALLSLTVWVGLSGIAFGQNNLELCGENNGQLMGLCWYAPEFSALWRPFLAEKNLTGKQLAFVIYFGLAYTYLSAPLWKYLAAESRRMISGFFYRQSKAIREWRF